VRYRDDEPLRTSEIDEAARARWQILHPVITDSFDDDYSPDDESSDDGSSDDEAPAPASPRPIWWMTALAFSREHVVVVVVALVVGVVFAVFTFQRSRADPLPSVPPVSIAAEEPSPTPTPTPVVKVHVLGAVTHPGVVTLSDGARVEDAIAAAGGLTPDADPALLNLAAVVADGSQIVIGTVGDPAGEVNGSSGGSTGASSSGTGVKVNINTASETELETLPGIGPVTAGKIIAYRTDHGKFSTVDELQEVSGIGPKTMAQLEPYVTV